MELQDAQKLVLSYMNEAADQFQKVPGSAMLIRQNFVTLSEEEIDDLVDEWTPEPLVAPLTTFEENVQEKLPVIVGMSGPKSKLANGRTVTNLASYNYYNLVANEHIKDKAIETLRTYGVGPCGPPQFYGTQDVHMKTEADVASHLGTEACIVYAQSFSTISSVIPAFSKRGDIIVADKACNYAIRKGLQICRSTIRWYEHNDMEDLERVLQRVVKEQSRKPLTRRFIVTEGLFETVGDCVDLPKVVELRLRYKFRLILDETWSFGVLGRTGRGVTEAQNVDSSSVDMIVGSLSGPLCAGGGFCAGSVDIVEHQRISAAAYTFSAALPAMMATTASEALNMLQTMPEILTGCRENIKAMRAQLDPRSDWITVTSAVDNPMVLCVLKPDVVNTRRLSTSDQERVLQECVDECLANGVLITRLKAMPVAPSSTAKEQGWQLQPALKVCVTTGLTKKETEKAGVVIRHAVTKVMTRKANSKLGVPAAA
ncbi:hypothetical protein V495_02036 [Pseudogymnoascus sp. VKM F-4514 (FW-929)]|nr:hypothetical protein V495_02036 [Pseudogymnoascus sp. VKM F-4514 (FW-929)]KFY61595.1 hypothetical protein V497_02865 [Pseudogymnoascus sp. VKM F-4516 (FW-969)]